MCKNVPEYAMSCHAIPWNNDSPTLLHIAIIVYHKQKKVLRSAPNNCIACDFCLALHIAMRIFQVFNSVS